MCSVGMKNKKLKSTKVGNKIKKVPSDISPSTSLPPLVEGQVRCFLRVTVGRVLWTIPQPPAPPLVRLRWWGESSSGTHFHPRDGSPVYQRGVKTTARFAIRCGPKQFTSYLTDMGFLVLEVLTKADHLPFGRVQVAGIARLSLSHSISGFFTLVSPTSEKLGELQVSLALEPLTETYDSCGSVRTVDVSTDMEISAPGPFSMAGPHDDARAAPPLSRPLSSNSGRQSVAGSSADTPRGKDHLYFQERSSGLEGPGSAALRNVAFAEKGLPSSRPQYDDEGLIPTYSTRRPENHVSADNHASKDILSVLLDRGSKLRNAMVVSALRSNLDSELALKDIPFPVSKDNVAASLSRLPMASSGKLLENLLHCEPGVPPIQRGLHSPEYPSLDCFADTENRAVDLLLGSVDASALWDGDSSPPGEFLSGTSSVLGDSELNDPLYDQSLLESLFYRAPKSDSSPSDVTAEEDGGLPTKKKHRKRRVTSAEKDEEERRRRSGRSVPEETKQIPEEDGAVPQLSADRVAALGRIHLAKVFIHSLTVPADSTPATPHKIPSKGKPPRPHPPRKCSYLVEYFFPVMSSKHDVNQAAMATEVIRIASCKVSEGVVKFQQRSVFPVQFGEAVIERWWNTDLSFNVYSRERLQKKPVAVGRAVFPLRSLLRSERQSQLMALPVLALEGGSSSSREGQELGTLKVSFELGEVSKDFSPAKPRGGGPSCQASPNAAPSPLRKAPPADDDTARAQPPSLDTDGEETSAVQRGGSGRGGGTPALEFGSSGTFSWVQQQQQQSEGESGVLLHALLVVPNGKDLTCGPAPPNVYLNCKLFGSDETTRSAVSWGQTDPTFNFIQVAPVVLSPTLLERMRNNVMVIEVWQKASRGQDRLLGLVKMPLQQFYMSFRDPKIARLLLQVQYPVVAVDSYMPIVDVFSGSGRGSLRVLLAMGLAEQVVSLQRMRDEDPGPVPHPPRPLHSLDHRQHPEPQQVNAGQGEATMEHVFEVTVERVKGLAPLQSTVWGEADCYVQYSFPSQGEDATAAQDLHAVESSVSLRQFRTGTTLCVPDPVFGHSESHALLAPAGVPVQRLLLSCCSSQGPSARGGIQFEVWCRYYYPNVRDQLVAKGLLPLAKLCAMVTMQTHEHTGPQVFSLPLLPQTESTTGHHPQPSGLLDVCVRYKPRPMRAPSLKGGAVASRIVTLAVQVHRAAGLRAAARALARRDEALQYHADVGVNAYVTAQLSFLPERERRTTRVVARSFCPEFDHHTEYPCNLLVQSAGGETCSLAELLDRATAVFTVCHRDSRKGPDWPASKDTVLGTVRIHLGDLIHKRTGISGWFPVSLPEDPGSTRARPSLAGGLEVTVSFAHHSDRERVVRAARGLGWEAGVEEEEDEDEEGEEEEGRARLVSLTVCTPRAWLPLHCLLLPGHRALERSTYCYLRYKVYEEPAFCSPLRHPSPEEGPQGAATVAFGGGHTVALRSTLPLRWYLREERLEVQVWVAFGKQRRARPHDTDRLVGSAFVDLSPLARRAEQRLSVSGVYPLFRRSASDLEGAALRPALPSASEEEEEEEEEGPMPPVTPSRHQAKSYVSSEQQQHASAEDSFAVTVTVERAMHLSLKGSPLAERSGGKPSCCVSYATAESESPVTTPVVADNDSPVWDHQWGGRLSKEVLVDPQQTMVFKVWHKGDVERVIGFASVDLSPLLSGFQSVCGWYNITDFNGQCQGQIKVSVSPMKGVQGLRGQRQAAHEDAAKDSAPLFQPFPLCYHTTAMYSTFPAHISRYTEQRINSTPDQQEALSSGRSSLNDRREEHIHNVRMFHQSLQEGERASSSSAPTDVPPSSATLFSALRKNLSELDDIQRYFSRKLSTPTFPGLSEEAQPPRPEKHRDSDPDSAQLLLRSNRLVGAVNSLIGDLHGPRLHAVPENTQGLSVPAAPADFLSTEDRFLPAERSESQRGLGPRRREEAETPRGGELPLTSPVPREMDEPGDSRSNAEEVRDADASLSPDEAQGERKAEEEEEEEEEDEEEQDYEETVIEPRALNEVTSVTDRTSPWTSLLSEADLGSLESLEEPQEQLCPSEEVESGRGAAARQTDAPPCDRSSEELLSTTPEEGPQTDRRLSEESDTDDGDTVEAARVRGRARGSRNAHRAPPRGSGPGPEETDNRDRDQDSEEERRTASHASEHLWEAGDGPRSEKASCRAEGKGSKRLDPVDIPNFFLPAHHLEASMRAMRIATVFPTAPPSETGKKSVRRGIPFGKALRPRPGIPSPSMNKEETKRIAKIFASRFTEEK
ncbi:hypothetical protein AAFF_G00347420 [Aldrovandia affinis]|uniref:C2 domain-containing protein n=1 Tax=Aldrovandia affinis TaxID=143900 RepID=A0AAD7WPS2_9TELE|nr:hypothetical protein AAFF_G00347420 [Aldrovandia affinis]